MADLLSLMKWPLIASLILPWLLVYLGLHIVQRGVIFVDLALAQTAAFGTCMSMVVGYLLVVPPAEVMKTFGLFVAVGIVHFLFRRKFLTISADAERAAAEGLN